MSFEEALAARAEFRRSQRERREHGGLRNRRQQRRGDDDKKAEGVDGDETPDDKDEPPSEDDEKSRSSTQTETSTSQQQQTRQTSITQTRLSTSTLQITQPAISESSQSSSRASATRKEVSPEPAVTNTVWTTSVVLITSVASTFPGTTAPLAITTAQGSAPSLTTSRQASSTSETGKIAAQTTGGSGISSTHESNTSKSSNADTILFTVIGTIAGIALFGALAFYIYRRVTKQKVSHDLREANAYHAPSIWGDNGAGSVVSDVRSRGSMAFVPPITVGRNQNQNQNQVGSFNRPDGSVVDREERLARVRTDLLGSRELQMGSSLSPGLMGGRGIQNGSGLRNVQTYEEEKEVVGEDPFQGVEEDRRSDFSWEAPKPVMLRQSTVESEASMPQWRDPVTWARDQARRNDLRGAVAPVDKDYP